MCIQLNEASRKELLGDMELKRKARASQYIALYQDINPVDFVVYFTADGGKDTKWNQSIRFEDMRWMMKEGELSIDEMLKLAMVGDVKVFCTCPDFLYGGYRYMGTQMDYNLSYKPENRFPHVRNPHLEGSICKHLYRTLFQLPMHYPIIKKRLKTYWQPKLDKKKAKGTK